MEGVVAAVLLIGGGLQALQTAAIVMGLPFAFILVVMVFSLHKGLLKEYEKEQLRIRSHEKESYKELIEHLMEDDTHSEKKESDSNA
jgi:choline/glycine/proline betaine transport protein